MRFRVKPGRDQDFLDAHKKVGGNWPDLLHANIVKTGERTYCIIAEWSDIDRGRGRVGADDRHSRRRHICVEEPSGRPCYGKARQADH